MRHLTADLLKAFNHPDLFTDLAVIGDWDGTGIAPINCHQAILYVRCPAFRKFLESNKDVDSKQGDEKSKAKPIFKIRGLKTPRLVSAFIKFIYTDTLSADDLTTSDVLQLLQWLPATQHRPTPTVDPIATTDLTVTTTTTTTSTTTSTQEENDDDDWYGRRILLENLRRQCIKVLHKGLSLSNVFRVLKKADKKQVLDAKWLCIFVIIELFRRSQETLKDLLLRELSSTESQSGTCFSFSFFSF